MSDTDAGWILLIVSSVAWLATWIMDYVESKHAMRNAYRRNVWRA